MAPAGSPPVLIAPPGLTGLRDGGAVIGTDVGIDPGAWGGSPSPAVAVQWERDGQAIPGATGPVYRPSPEEEGARLGAEVKASNPRGTARAVTAAHRVAWPRHRPPAAFPTRSFSKIQERRP